MKGVVVLLLVLGLLAPGGARADDGLQAFVQDSRALVKAFAGELKGALGDFNARFAAELGTPASA